VHKCAEEWEGAPNKNYGDKFFITWKLPSPKDSSSYHNSNQYEQEMKEQHDQFMQGPGDLMNNSVNVNDASHAELISG